MGRKRQLRVTVKRVPAASLRPNPLDEYAGESREQRRQGMVAAVARGLANILIQQANERPTTGEQGGSDGGRSALPSS